MCTKILNLNYFKLFQVLSTTQCFKIIIFYQYHVPGCVFYLTSALTLNELVCHLKLHQSLSMGTRQFSR